MDKYFLFEMLLEEAERYAVNPIGDKDEHRTLFPRWLNNDNFSDHFTDILIELNGRKDIPYLGFNVHEKGAIKKLRALYNDNISLISAALALLRPKEYLFYNPLTIEDEIFEGFKYFTDVVPEFMEINFDRVGRGKNRYDRYSILNGALIKMAKRYWPEIDMPHYLIEGLLYHSLGPLFTEYSDYNRYWIIATKPDYFDVLDNNDEVVWSAKKGMQAGDKLFVYRTSPVKAITDIYEAVEDAYFHPISAWNGYWVKMKRLCKIPPITFSSMRSDPILKDWWVVKKQFTGTITDPVSFRMFNRLIELVPDKIRGQYRLKPEPITNFPTSGVFDSEGDFEDKVINPLLKRLSIKYSRQHVCRFQIGSQPMRGRIDYVLYHKNIPYCIIENKLRILNDSDLYKAKEQAKSYALQLGVERLVVASPEGFWFYKLKLNVETLITKIGADEISKNEEKLAKLIRA